MALNLIEHLQKKLPAIIKKFNFLKHFVFYVLRTKQHKYKNVMIKSYLIYCKTKYTKKKKKSIYVPSVN